MTTSTNDIKITLSPIVDAFSIALIQSRPEIDAVFAFDHHMNLAGLPVLPGPLS